MTLPLREAKNASTFLLFLLGISLAINVYLGWRIKILNASVQAVKNVRMPIPGTKLASISVFSLDGAQTRFALDTGGQPTILYILSPTCSWCDANMENIRALSLATNQRYRILGVSIKNSGTKEYVQSKEFPFQVFVAEGEGLGFHVSGTPQTIVIDSDGTVLQNWSGAYADKTKREIEAFFGVSIPGLISSPAGN